MEDLDASQPVPASGHRPGLLYPLLLIVAISVLVFTIAGTATLMGWLPDGLSRTPPATTDGASKRAPAGACSECGVIESIRTVEVTGPGSGLGMVAGAVVGGLVGSQLGSGHARAAATVVGAGAGAIAGHQMEKAAATAMSYQVRVRMSDGSTRTFYERAEPAFSIGEIVRVTGRELAVAS